MSQSTKILLGILTILPFLLLLVLLSMVFGFAFGIIGDVTMHGEPDPTMLASNVFPIILIASAIGLLSMAIMIYYIVHVMSNKNIENSVQVVWVLILLLTSPIGSMVYWFMNIWNDPVPSAKPMVDSGYTN